MRVLLISPVPAVDPQCGDVTYTEGLLRHPPPGVEYETYTDAIEAGRLFELGRRSDIQQSRGWGRLAAVVRVVRERAINTLRRNGVLFREPFRHFVVRPGSYDLVHCHVFSASFRGLDAPLVMSNASVIEELYRGARGWSALHIWMASHLDVFLARLLRVQHTSHAMPSASAVVTFTQALLLELTRRKSTYPERLHVAPCFVEAAARRAPNTVPNVVGFVAGDFDSKGGPTVLEAFAIVRRERSDAELLIVGSQPRFPKYELVNRGISWLPNVSRAELLGEHLPRMDVFAYPTQFDGLPLTVLEAMALGVPVVTSDYCAMPEIIGWGEAGCVVPQKDAWALARALLRLLEPQQNAEQRQRSAKWFDIHYSPDSAIEELSKAYKSALRIGTAA